MFIFVIMNEEIKWSQWKQPIPVNLEEIFGTDHKSNLLFRELIYRACNKDTILSLDGKKHVQLKRGQVLFGRKKFAEYLGWSPSTTERTLQKLQKLNKLLNMQVTKNFTIVELINYDSIISFEQAFEQAVNKQRTSSEQAVNTSKSVKSVKSVKNVDNKKENIKRKNKTDEELSDFWKQAIDWGEKIGVDIDISSLFMKEFERDYEKSELADVIRRAIQWIADNPRKAGDNVLRTSRLQKFLANTQKKLRYPRDEAFLKREHARLGTGFFFQEYRYCFPDSATFHEFCNDNRKNL